MQHIANLDREKLGIYEELLITDEVILTDERLFEHILLLHREEYSELRPYIKEIIEYPVYGHKRCRKWYTCQIITKHLNCLGAFL